jgi:hypothetical protein
MMLARREAERLLNKARLEAERILASARLEAHEIDWQSKGQGIRPPQDQAEWPESPDMPGVEMPTGAVDIPAKWDRDDSAVREEPETAQPKLFEEPSPPPAIHIPDAWRANGHPPPRDTSNELKEPSDSEDLDVHLDVSILDLFENPED